MWIPLGTDMRSCRPSYDGGKSPPYVHVTSVPPCENVALSDNQRPPRVLQSYRSESSSFQKHGQCSKWVGSLAPPSLFSCPKRRTVITKGRERFVVLVMRVCVSCFWISFVEGRLREDRDRRGISEVCLRICSGDERQFEGRNGQYFVAQVRKLYAAGSPGCSAPLPGVNLVERTLEVSG